MVKKPPIMEMVVQKRLFHFFHFSSSVCTERWEGAVNHRLPVSVNHCTTTRSRDGLGANCQGRTSGRGVAILGRT